MKTMEAPEKIQPSSPRLRPGWRSARLKFGVWCFSGAWVLVLGASGHAQSADWQSVIWRDPQVRYLLADMTLGGNTKLYRDYATTERDPDSREAIRLWDAGARVVNTNEFERRWVTNRFGKDGRVMRIVHRGSERTITGNEVLLTSDFAFDQTAMRLALLDLTLGSTVSFDVRTLLSSVGKTADVTMAEAVRRWNAGARVLNAHWFATKGEGRKRRLVYRGTGLAADGSRVQLNSDLAYPETNVRYFLADMSLGGSHDFYHRTAEAAHEMGCQEAVVRHDTGVKVTNLDQFERKKVDGKTLITRKGSNERISGMEVKLSTE